HRDLQYSLHRLQRSRVHDGTVELALMNKVLFGKIGRRERDVSKDDGGDGAASRLRRGYAHLPACFSRRRTKSIDGAAAGGEQRRWNALRTQSFYGAIYGISFADPTWIQFNAGSQEPNRALPGIQPDFLPAHIGSRCS